MDITKIRSYAVSFRGKCGRPLQRAKYLAVGIGAAGCALVAPTYSMATDWAMATAFPATNFQTKNDIEFIEDVKRATAGKLLIKLHENQSLLTMPQIKRAVRSGQVQIGEVVLSAYGNEDPFYEVDSVPMLSQGHVNALRLWRVSKPYIEKRFAAEGLVPLYSVAWPSQGIYSKKPLSALADLRGAKFRSYNPVTARMADLLGATPTTVQQAEVAQAFATGIIDSMITSAMTGVEIQAWDFLKYYYDLRAINNKNIVFMNKKAFDALGKSEQKAVLEAAARAEERGWAKSAQAVKDTNETLAAHGIQVIQPNATMKGEMKKIGDSMTADWLKRAGPEGEAMLKTYQEEK